MTPAAIIMLGVVLLVVEIGIAAYLLDVPGLWIVGISFVVVTIAAVVVGRFASRAARAPSSGAEDDSSGSEQESSGGIR